MARAARQSPLSRVGTKSQRILYSVLGVGLVALAADNLIPGDAGPSQASADLLLHSDHEPVRRSPDVTPLAARMRQADPGHGPATAALFDVPADWLPQAASAQPQQDALPQAPLPTLTGVALARTPEMSVANLDGSMVRVGQVHRGWVLREVSPGGVMLTEQSTGRSASVRLKGP